METKKNDTNEFIVKTGIANTFMVTKGERIGGGINQEFGINNIHITILKIDNQQKPTG